MKCCNWNVKQTRVLPQITVYTNAMPQRNGTFHIYFPGVPHTVYSCSGTNNLQVCICNRPESMLYFCFLLIPSATDDNVVPVVCVFDYTVFPAFYHLYLYGFCLVNKNMNNSTNIPMCRAVQFVCTEYMLGHNYKKLVYRFFV